VKALGYKSNEDAVGSTLFTSQAYEIVGVLPDIRHNDAKKPSKPKVYFLGEGLDPFYTVRTEGSKESLQHAIELLWPRYFPNDVLNMKPITKEFAEQYEEDQRLAKLLAASSLIAIVLAGFGIYVLAAYSVQRRTKSLFCANCTARITKKS